MLVDVPGFSSDCLLCVYIRDGRDLSELMSDPVEWVMLAFQHVEEWTRPVWNPPIPTPRCVLLRRAAIKAGERFTTEEIAKRDQWRCHICGKKVRPADLSIDHLIPIVAGGPHTRANVSLAHRRCNSKRHTGQTIPAQLRLVG